MLAEIGRHSAEIPRVDRIQAKLTTGAVFTVEEARDGSVTSIEPKPDALLWVVAVGGEIHPLFGTTRVPAYTSGEWWYDAQTGDAIAMSANRGPTWPAGFDDIRDLAG